MSSIRLKFIQARLKTMAVILSANGALRRPAVAAFPRLSYDGAVKHAVLALMLAAAAPAAASAGVAGCRLERGVLIAPAEVGGVSGDFIVDTGQARTELTGEQA